MSDNQNKSKSYQSGVLLATVEGDLYTLQANEFTQSRKSIFKLYQTENKQFLCFREDPIQKSRGERGVKIAIASNEDEVIDFFGKCNLSQELYDEAVFISNNRWPD